MKYKEIDQEKLNELESFIRGSILGDGYIGYSSKYSKEANLAFGHGLKQEKYLEWKNEFLSKYELCGKIHSYTHISDRYKSGKCTTKSFKSSTHPIFSKFRNFYYNGKKFVNEEDVQKLDEFALAIWFMDDGSLWRRKNRSDVYVLNTQSFCVKDKEILQKVLLNKFKIKTSILKPDGELRIALESMPIFYSLIKKYVLDIFDYKLKWVHLKLGELGGQP